MSISTNTAAMIPTGWRDKLAVINEFKLSNAQAVSMFNTTEKELETARSLVSRGVIQVPALDEAQKTQWSSLVQSAPAPTTKVTVIAAPTPRTASAATQPVKNTTGAKRGRVGNKIINALNAVPTTPQPIDAFITQYGVSKTVLRQSKRFLDTPLKISIKRDKTTGIEMICRK